MKPVGFEEKDTESLSIAETAGNFPGSPIVLTYHLEIVRRLQKTAHFCTS